MAAIKGRAGKGAVAPVAKDGGQGPKRGGDSDARGPDRKGQAEPAPKRVAKDWGQIASVLSALERDGCPVCHVVFPGEAPDVWFGIYGGAAVVKGDKAEAITSDGTRHPL